MIKAMQQKRGEMTRGARMMSPLHQKPRRSLPRIALAEARERGTRRAAEERDAARAARDEGALQLNKVTAAAAEARGLLEARLCSGSEARQSLGYLQT